MKRPVTGLLVLILSLSFGASRVMAAGDPDSKPRFDFSAKAAGISEMVAMVKPSPAPVLARAQQTNPTKKSFWKSPWPYVIIGGAIAVGAIIAMSGDGSGY